MNAQISYTCQSADNHNDNRASRQPLKFVRGTQLTREHLVDECLTKRGLDIDWVIANCRSVTAEEGSKRLGYTAYSDGIVFESWNGQTQFRPDDPWESEDENGKKSEPKYRSAKGKYDVILPNSPDDSYDWMDFDSLKKKCFKVNGVPCLVITEGMFKAIAGCSNGIPTIALLGVEMGLTPKHDDPDEKRYLLLWLREFARRGFGFIIAFDADIATNKNVRLAQKNLYLKLKECETKVFIASGFWSIEQGKGMDDYIQKNGADKFKR